MRPPGTHDGPVVPRVGGDKGPIRTLCDEIDFPWDARLERTDVLVAFVRGLVAEIAQDRDMAQTIAHVTGKPPSEASLKVLRLTEGMLSVQGERALIGGAKMVHDAARDLSPEDAYPTDHLIDMLSSCASAIRFGLEWPCMSRHAAEASNHVWRRLYGVSRFDSHTPARSKAWARSCLQNAILSLLPPSVARERSDTGHTNGNSGNTPDQDQRP